MKPDKRTIEWLLESANPTVRYLVLSNILNRETSDPELKKARNLSVSTGAVSTILNKMNPDGYWVKPGGGYSPKYFSGVWSLITLSQLGATVDDDPRIKKACRYYLDHAFFEGGYIAYNQQPSGTFDCLQGNMCAALTTLGFEDKRLKEAYDWMARSVTGEGVGTVGDRSAPLRYHAAKCGPNFACVANGKKPCAWGAVKVMLAFSVLPEHERSPRIREAVKAGTQFLLDREISKADYPTADGRPTSRSWFKFGFPVYYVTDMLQIVEVLARLGFSSDSNVQKAVEFILSKKDQDGRWNLEYNLDKKTWCDWGEMRKPNKWVTYRVYNTLKSL